MAKVYIATTSFKGESFLDLLAIYKRLGWMDIDINLSPFLFEKEKTSAFIAAIQSHDFSVGFASGGWCDFFQTGSDWEKTQLMVEQQVAAIKAIGVSRMRLFFGRLHLEDFTEKHLDIVTRNISYFGRKYPEIKFSFENHDGVSLDPNSVTRIIRNIDLPNVGLTLDPVNYARKGSDPFEAIKQHKDKIFHVHVKGLTKDKNYCEYGSGEYNYLSVLKELKKQNYMGDFTLEYEGESNPIFRIFKSLKQLNLDLTQLGFKE